MSKRARYRPWFGDPEPRKEAVRRLLRAVIDYGGSVDRLTLELFIAVLVEDVPPFGARQSVWGDVSMDEWLDCDVEPPVMLTLEGDADELQALLDAARAEDPDAFRGVKVSRKLPVFGGFIRADEPGGQQGPAR